MKGEEKLLTRLVTVDNEPALVYDIATVGIASVTRDSGASSAIASSSLSGAGLGQATLAGLVCKMINSHEYAVLITIGE